MFREVTFTLSVLPCNLDLAVLRKSLISVFCASVLFAQTGDALAAFRSAKAPTTTKKKVVTTETVTGPSVKCHQWGFMEVQLKVIKTVTTAANGKKSVAIKITAVNWPIYPDHTPKSKYINAQALPLLQGEVLQLQASSGKKLENISGATHTTVSWRESLQAALAKAETP
jgi:uncharacterized protein with FMN-binding domain